jgi:hypothetical protein
MRFFNAICTWLYWLAIVYFWAGTIFICVADSYSVAAGKPAIVVHRPEFITSTRQIHGVALIITGAATIILYMIRRRSWFRKRQRTGIGYWVITSLLYAFLLLTIGNCVAPYFVAGDRTILLNAGLPIGLAFIILCFPRLPARPAADPPPISP